MHIAIVTGESKGLGKSIATLFLQKGVHVIGISRTGNEELIKVAKQNEVTYEHYPCDLSDTDKTEEAIHNINENIFQKNIANLFVVNNAAVVGPIDQAMNTSAQDLSHHFQINTIAPMIIMNAVLKRATEKGINVVGATVTSGAAERPVYGWSAYCSSKASINMYTQTVALEQDEKKTGHKVIAFSPGIMDTSMQEQIRSTSVSEFIQVEQFRNYKKNELLMDTHAVGQVLVSIMRDDKQIKNGKIYNVRDYLS